MGDHQDTSSPTVNPTTPTALGEPNTTPANTEEPHPILPKDTNESEVKNDSIVKEKFAALSIRDNNDAQNENLPGRQIGPENGVGVVTEGNAENETASSSSEKPDVRGNDGAGAEDPLELLKHHLDNVRPIIIKQKGDDKKFSEHHLKYVDLCNSYMKLKEGELLEREKDREEQQSTTAEDVPKFTADEIIAKMVEYGRKSLDEIYQLRNMPVKEHLSSLDYILLYNTKPEGQLRNSIENLISFRPLKTSEIRTPKQFVRFLHWNICGEGEYYDMKMKALKRVSEEMNVDVILLTESFGIEPNCKDLQNCFPKNDMLGSCHFEKKSAKSRGMLAVWRGLSGVFIKVTRQIQWKCHHETENDDIEGFTLLISFRGYSFQHFLHYVYHVPKDKKEPECKTTIASKFSDHKLPFHFNSVVGDLNMVEDDSFEAQMNLQEFVRVSSKNEWTNRKVTTPPSSTCTKIDVVYTTPPPPQFKETKIYAPLPYYVRTHRPIIAHKVYKEIKEDYNEEHKDFHKIVVFDLGIKIDDPYNDFQCHKSDCFCSVKSRSCYFDCGPHNASKPECNCPPDNQ